MYPDSEESFSLIGSLTAIPYQKIQPTALGDDRIKNVPQIDSRSLSHKWHNAKGELNMAHFSAGFCSD